VRRLWSEMAFAERHQATGRKPLGFHGPSLPTLGTRKVVRGGWDHEVPGSVYMTLGQLAGDMASPGAPTRHLACRRKSTILRAPWHAQCLPWLRIPQAKGIKLCHSPPLANTG
jgi:hypothetical protein